jgi:hypothetical protein
MASFVFAPLWNEESEKRGKRLLVTAAFSVLHTNLYRKTSPF